MPMNPRLLRPTSSTLDADAAVYLNAVAQADGQQLEPAVRKAINDFVVGCKSDGIWDAIKASCILAGARTLAGALVPLKGAAPTNNNFTASDYNRETGLVGDGSTTYLDTNRANDDDPQDDNHNAVYVTEDVAGAALIGAGGANAGANNIGSGTSPAKLFFRSRNSSVTNTQTGGDTPYTGGFAGISRSAGDSFDLRASSLTETFSVSSQTPSSGNVEVFSRGAPSQAFTSSRIAFYSIGESLDLAALDARVSALITAIGNAI